MIIGQFGESYPPTIDGVGGVMINYCREMNRRGHRSIFVGPNNKESTGLPDVETRLYTAMKLAKVPYRAGFPQIQPLFKRELKGIPFDIVHAHAPFMAGWLAREIAREKNIPLVATFHSKYYDDFYRVTHSHAVTKRLIKVVMNFFEDCDEVWTVNESTARVLQEYGYKGPITIMQNGVNPDEGAAEGDISDLPLKENVARLLFVGQQDYKKGTRELIRSCGILKQEDVSFQLVMVGEGQDRSALEKEARELGIGEDVLFTGRISDRDRLMAIYRQADLFVFPSVYDNAPLVVREAAQVGTPSLVVSGSCAAEGMEDGKNGFLCDGSAADIAECIKKALPMAEQVGQEARRSIPITWELIGGHIEKRYQDLIEKRKAEATRES